MVSMTCEVKWYSTKEALPDKGEKIIFCTKEECFDGEFEHTPDGAQFVANTVWENDEPISREFSIEEVSFWADIPKIDYYKIANLRTRQSDSREYEFVLDKEQIEKYRKLNPEKDILINKYSHKLYKKEIDADLVRWLILLDANDNEQLELINLLKEMDCNFLL